MLAPSDLGEEGRRRQHSPMRGEGRNARPRQPGLERLGVGERAAVPPGDGAARVVEGIARLHRLRQPVEEQPLAQPEGREQHLARPSGCEGLLFDRLQQAVQACDPLHDACRAIARRDGRSLAYAEALESWLARATVPAFAAHRGVLPAAAFLSEIAWRQHPDFRAADAFARISRAPFVGIDHPGRVFLALAVATRYKSGLPAETDWVVNRLLSNAAQAEARALGLSLRLAERLSCGEPAVLEGSALTADDGLLTLRVAPEHLPLVSGKAQSAAEALARTLARTLCVEASG